MTVLLERARKGQSLCLYPCTCCWYGDGYSVVELFVVNCVVSILLLVSDQWGQSVSP